MPDAWRLLSRQRLSHTPTDMQSIGSESSLSITCPLLSPGEETPETGSSEWAQTSQMESPGSERGKAEKEGQGVSQENTKQKNKNIARGA